MIRDILERYGVYEFAHIDAKACPAGNRRLHGALPENCRVVFALFPYYVEDTAPGIAKFAAVPDYHSFAKELFDAVCEYVGGKYPDAYIRGFADHSPFDERRGAAAAGLGVLGMNGLLINDRCSSFFCIGELVCTLGAEELCAEGIPDADGHEIGRCHGCGACAAACPGRCAGSDGRITCASALNQMKRCPTEEEKAIILKSGYIWGCDVCQLVCPYTKHAKDRGTLETPIEFFKNGAIQKNVGEAVRNMSDEEFGKYPFAWRKRDIIERNIRLFESAKKDGKCGD